MWWDACTELKGEGRDIEQSDVAGMTGTQVVLLFEHFSRLMKEFVSLCLKKVPAERLSAKELHKHCFIRTARKSPRLQERIRERPKYQIKEEDDDEEKRNIVKAMFTKNNILWSRKEHQT